MSRALETFASVWDRASRVWPLATIRDMASLTVLNHHRIADRVDHDEGVISATPAQFAAQAEWLRDHATVVDGARVLAATRGDVRFDHPAVCLTFDDGYADNYAAGVLLKEWFGLNAIFFVTTGFIETGVVPQWDRIAFVTRWSRRETLATRAGGRRWTFDLMDRKTALRGAKQIYRSLPNGQREGFVDGLEQSGGLSALDAAADGALFMRWDQIRHLHALGHTIGAHTHSHPHLASLSADEQREELGRSREILESQLRAPVTMMAYPFGRPDSFTGTTERIARECGFEAAFSFFGGVNRRPDLRPLALRRNGVERDASDRVFRARATGQFPF